jgi:hypothetical protein
MKYRTCLLAVCMVVVPTLAMFSHHLPADTRRSVRDCVSEVRGWVAGTLASIGAPSVSTAAAPAAVEGTMQTVGRDEGQRETAAADALTPVMGLPEAPPLPGAPAPAASLDEAMQHLAELGAESIECVALPGLAGRHLASCRVPLDAERQLHRVFQTEGFGAGAATSRLLDEVTAWRRRIANRAGGLGAVPDGRPTAGRF